MDCVKKTIAGLVAECSFDEQCYTIQGQAGGKSFFVAFKGTTNLAATRAEELLGSLRDDSGEKPVWKRVTTHDTNGHEAELHLSKDKSLCTERREILTKKLAGLLAEAGVPEVFGKKWNGEVTANWAPIAKVHVESRDEATVLWNNEVVSQYPSLDKAKVAAKFQERGHGAHAPANWSSS